MISSSELKNGKIKKGPHLTSFDLISSKFLIPIALESRNRLFLESVLSPHH